MNKAKIKTIAYWVTTILGPFSFVIGGTLYLTQDQQVLTNFAHLGFPLYLTYFMGVCKFLGAIVTVIPGVPRLKEWAYAGFFFELSSGVVSHIAVGDPFVGGETPAIAPLVFLLLVMASWALRPESRRLQKTNS
jgi:uncharacterized membrane protein YphA (DoxX/SURF4 family)